MCLRPGTRYLGVRPVRDLEAGRTVASGQHRCYPSLAKKRRHPKMPPSLGRKRPARRQNRIAGCRLFLLRADASKIGATHNDIIIAWHLYRSRLSSPEAAGQVHLERWRRSRPKRHTGAAGGIARPSILVEQPPVALDQDDQIAPVAEDVFYLNLAAPSGVAFKLAGRAGFRSQPVCRQHDTIETSIRLPARPWPAMKGSLSRWRWCLIQVADVERQPRTLSAAPLRCWHERVKNLGHYAASWSAW